MFCYKILCTSHTLVSIEFIFYFITYCARVIHWFLQSSYIILSHIVHESHAGFCSLHILFYHISCTSHTLVSAVVSCFITIYSVHASFTCFCSVYFLFYHIFCTSHTLVAAVLTCYITYCAWVTRWLLHCLHILLLMTHPLVTVEGC
jgi:hypothetical protein